MNIDFIVSAEKEIEKIIPEMGIIVNIEKNNIMLNIFTDQAGTSLRKDQIKTILEIIEKAQKTFEERK